MKKTTVLRNYERVNPVRYKTSEKQRAAAAERYLRKRQELLTHWRSLPKAARDDKNRRSREWKALNKGRLSSPEYKIVQMVSGRIHQRGFRPLAGAEELLGCTVRQFIAYIEAKFTSQMTWENHAKLWEFDHIKPIEKFDLSTLRGQKAAQHYSNWQPLHKLEHAIKTRIEQATRPA